MRTAPAEMEKIKRNEKSEKARSIWFVILRVLSQLPPIAHLRSRSKVMKSRPTHATNAPFRVFSWKIAQRSRN